MRIIVLGSNGMAGHMIAKYLEVAGYDVIKVARNNADVMCNLENPKDLYNLTNWAFVNHVDYVINCVGVLVSDSIKNVPRTIHVNALLPKMLEEEFKCTPTKVIHISTDCIFDGKRGYYIENDLPSETNIYGRSKALGEINNEKDITFRMSIIGTEIKPKEYRSGLLNWVINNPEKSIQGWTESKWNGITTYQLAKNIRDYIEHPVISGIYHLVPDFSISKYNLVSLINKEFNAGKEIQKVPGKSENKILINTRKEDRAYFIPSYSTQLQELKRFADNHLNLNSC